MKKLFNKTKLLVAISVLVFSSVLLMINVETKIAFAEEMPTVRETYIGYNSNNENWYYDDLSVSDKPMITVLTHGLDSAASSWSNTEGGNYSFAFDSESLIEQLRSKNGANVYWAKMDHNSGVPATNFHLMKLEQQTQLSAYSENLPTETQLELAVTGT